MPAALSKQDGNASTNPVISKNLEMTKSVSFGHQEDDEEEEDTFDSKPLPSVVDRTRTASGAKKGRLTALHDLKSMSSFAYSVRESVAENYEGSVVGIFKETVKIVNLCLGPGQFFQVCLFLVSLLEAFAGVALATTASALILSVLNYSSAGVRSPIQLAGGLLILALGICSVSLLKHYLLNHAGDWFARRAKHALANSSSRTTGKEETDFMSHLAAIRTIFLEDKYTMITKQLTEFLCLVGICCIQVEDWNLFLVALALIVVGHSLCILDNFMLIQEQHHKADIIAKIQSSTEKIEEDRLEEDVRFFHNATSGRHVAVKITLNLYTHVAPVLFFYLAMKFGSFSSDDDGAITSQQVLQSNIFFFLAMMSQMKQHGKMLHIVNNIYHCDKLLRFNASKGDFLSLYRTDPDAVIPFSKAKNSTKFTVTHTEKVALSFTLLAFMATVVVASVFLTSVDLSCGDVTITCNHVPDDGTHATFQAAQDFDIFLGCTVAVDNNDIVDLCVEKFKELDQEVTEEIDFDIIEADLQAADDNSFAADVAATNHAITAMQMAADSNPVLQIDSHSQIVVAASYKTWRTGAIKRFERVYALDKKKEAEALADGRRLAGDDSENWTDWSANGETFFSTPITPKGSFVVYNIEVTVDTKRYSDSPNGVEIELIGPDSTTSRLALGGTKTDKWAKGQVRQITVFAQQEVSSIESVRLTSNGKNGVRFSKVVIDRPVSSFETGWTEFSMDNMLYCQGSKRAKTYSCSLDFSVRYGGDDVEEEEELPADHCPDESCNYGTYWNDPLDFEELSNFNVDTTDLDKLVYGFGTVWNDCNVNGAVRFATTSICDKGCFPRASGFKLSPTSAFKDPAKGEKAGENNDAGCQQKNGNAYPKYCLEPLDLEGKPWSFDGKSKEEQATCVLKVGHDRGHQIPANNWDSDAQICKDTNFMTNIMPQADTMNRGAWLKTEMMAECWRNVQPLTVLGGGVFTVEGNAELQVPEWGEHDRTYWFRDSHYVKNPGYFWKVIVGKGLSKKYGSSVNSDASSKVIAFFMPNHESAKASVAQDYVVSLNQLEALLLKWGAPETFTIDGWEGEMKNVVPSIWDDPAGCQRM